MCVCVCEPISANLKTNLELAWSTQEEIHLTTTLWWRARCVLIKLQLYVCKIRTIILLPQDVLGTPANLPLRVATDNWTSPRPHCDCELGKSKTLTKSVKPNHRAPSPTSTVPAGRTKRTVRTRLRDDNEDEELHEKESAKARLER